MKKIKVTVLVLAASIIMPTIVSACPLCQAGATKRTQKAYEETTAILALIPILAGGGITLWLYKRGKQN